jgi:hydrogenase small subunit
VNGTAPPIPVDDVLRPTWLFSTTVHEGCNRAGFYEEGNYATGYGGAPSCLVKVGCWGPAVLCPVPKRGWINGIGGCPSVGGICVGCTMPGFPDMFMPFMDEPHGVTVPGPSLQAHSGFIRELRRITGKALEIEPPWRKRTKVLLTGYEPPW